jgi:hypothetical protein
MPNGGKDMMTCKVVGVIGCVGHYSYQIWQYRS